LVEIHLVVDDVDVHVFVAPLAHLLAVDVHLEVHDIPAFVFVLLLQLAVALFALLGFILDQPAVVFDTLQLGSRLLDACLREFGFLLDALHLVVELFVFKFCNLFLAQLSQLDFAVYHFVFLFGAEPFADVVEDRHTH